MKTVRAYLCIILSVVLLASCCICLADSSKDYSGYRTYVSLGDSIANGIGENNPGVNKYMYRTPGAYPDRIANEISAELTQLACGGMRTVELRACLEDDYYMPDEFANNFNRAKIQEIRGLYAPAIAKADLITLNIGLNDIMTYAMLRAKAATSELGVRIDSSIAKLEENGEYTAALVKLLEAVKTVDKYGNIVKAAIDGLYDGYTRFDKNWDAVIGDIYALNPDVTLMVAGVYNPFDHLKIADSMHLELGKAADGIMELINCKIKYDCPYSKDYIYVDIMGAESMAAKFGDSLTDEGFFQSVELNVHPSNEGQADIAQRFISLIPEKPAVPFTDIAAKPADFKEAIAWAYSNGITYGKTADRFCPDESCTRGQVASFLWRAAGCPEPENSSCPFVDVDPSSVHYKAIIWAWEKGITLGVDATHFEPNATCTRGQIVTFIYRYDGSPAVSSKCPFTDVDKDSPYLNAITWAAKEGITLGVDATHFEPNSPCTRAQIVTFLYRDMSK